MEKTKFTLQSNQVALSRINLANVYEKRLLNALVDSLSPHLKGKIEETKNETKGIHINEQKELGFTIGESIMYTYKLSDVEPNHQNYDRLRAAIKKLRQTDVDIITADGTEIYTGLIEAAEINHRADTFKARINLTAYQFLCDLSKGYSIKNFKTALELKSLYSSDIYDLLCKWRNKQTFQIDVEELRFITNTTNKNKPINDFKKRVLDSAKKELDASHFTDLTFSYEDIKRGRTIVGFKFHVFHTKNDTLLTSKLTKQISPNWDFEKSVIEYLNRNDINFNGANRSLFKKFFKLKGTSLGLDFLEKTKDLALRKSRDNPQGYIVAAIKKHIEQKSPTSSIQMSILDEITERKKG